MKVIWDGTIWRNLKKLLNYPFHKKPKPSEVYHLTYQDILDTITKLKKEKQFYWFDEWD